MSHEENGAHKNMSEEEFKKKSLELKPKVQVILEQLNGQSATDGVAILTYAFGCLMSQLNPVQRLEAILMFTTYLPSATETAENAIIEQARRN